ncbi:MAG TPA: lycopene cyclase domain-containing protein [Chloroflexota bacterium]|nr:lycopene cyclase domain-containing protein [Chloroflexota bacterium]
MTYLEFLIIFLILPICALRLVWRIRLDRWTLGALAFTMAAALAYTAPWDNALVRNGVWSFARGQVIGPIIGVIPIEEYTFYLLQVVLTGLVVLILLDRPRLGR